MSLRDDLAGVLARDPRYSIHAYAFVFESLEYTKMLRKKARAQAQSRAQADGKPLARRTARKGRVEGAQHVSGQELCRGARELAQRHYGLMALAVLAQWGIRSTSDLGEIVYNLIRSGDLEKTPHDRRTDFDNVFDFEAALRHDYVVVLDDVA